MPDELRVAILTQTLRADACAAYIAATQDSTFVVFAGDPKVFAELYLPPGTNVKSTSSRPALLDSHLAVAAARRRILGWMRSGSRFGRLAERTTRRIARLAGPASHEPVTRVKDHPINHELLSELRDLNHRSRISEISLFDVFDLPTALEFSDETDVVVVVR